MNAFTVSCLPLLVDRWYCRKVSTRGHTRRRSPSRHKTHGLKVINQPYINDLWWRRSSQHHGFPKMNILSKDLSPLKPNIIGWLSVKCILGLQSRYCIRTDLLEVSCDDSQYMLVRRTWGRNTKHRNNSWQHLLLLLLSSTNTSSDRLKHSPPQEHVYNQNLHKRWIIWRLHNTQDLKLTTGLCKNSRFYSYYQ